MRITLRIPTFRRARINRNLIYIFTICSIGSRAWGISRGDGGGAENGLYVGYARLTSKLKAQCPRENGSFLLQGEGWDGGSDGADKIHPD